MQPCRLIVSLLLPLAALSCRAVLAEEIRIPRGPLQPEQASVVPAAHWLHEAMPPLPQPALLEPGAAKSDTSPFHQQSDSPASLTLDDLEQIALSWNPTLVQARMAVRAAQGRYVQAGLYPNPEIGYAGADVGIEGTAGQQGAVLGQEIVTSGKLRLGRAVASYEVQQVRYGWEMQQWRVLNDVRAGYYEVLLAQKMIEVNEDLARIGEEGVNVTEQLRAAMEVGRADVLQARIEAQMAKLNLNEARDYHRAAWRRLAAVLGRPEMEPAPLAGDVDEDPAEFNWEETLTQLLTQSPELGQARAGVERARCELAYQYAQRIPNFGVGVGAKYDHAARNALADVEVILPLPLFNRNQGNIINAQADLIAAQHEVRRVELSLHDQLAATFEQYANARRQVKTYASSVLPDAKASLDLIGAGYREGEFGYLVLLTAQRTFFHVNLNYLANLRELWTRSVELEGLLLRGGLDEVQLPEPSGD